jgi:hypothetical protein
MDVVSRCAHKMKMCIDRGTLDVTGWGAGVDGGGVQRSAGGNSSPGRP